MPASPDAEEIEVVARNKRARYDYHIIETWEAGLVLTGTEVKALRQGKASVADAYGIVRNGEVFLLNMHIPAYEQGNRANHEPTRTRKMLLHRREIRKLIGAVERQGLTLMPLEIHFRKGVAMAVISLATGKQAHDKRETEKGREAQREIARAIRTR